MKSKQLLVLLILLSTSSSLFFVKAQTGTGSYGLLINPTSGPAGTEITFSYQVDRAAAYLYRGETFQIVWDIGGWNGDQPADWNTVQKLTWKIIGSATFNSSGHLSGTAITPTEASNQIGDHVVYAVSPKIAEGTTMNFWWGFFEITSGGPSSSQSSTFPSLAPSDAPAEHPDMVTLKINGPMGTRSNDFAILVQNELVSLPFSWSWPYGTTVVVEAIYQGDDSYAFDHWAWTSWITGGQVEHSSTSKIIYLNMTENISARPVEISTRRGDDIPGFPIESIGFGLLIGLTSIYLFKKNKVHAFP